MHCVSPPFPTTILPTISDNFFFPYNIFNFPFFSVRDTELSEQDFLYHMAPTPIYVILVVCGTSFFLCTMCLQNLCAWMKGTRKCMTFAIPMICRAIWRDPIDHLNDCYFRITKIKGFAAVPKVAFNNATSIL